MDHKKRVVAQKFLSDLTIIGDVGSYEDIWKNKKNLILIGKIVKITSCTNYAVCHLHEEVTRVYFKVFFHRDAVKVLTKKLTENDYLAILRPKPFRDFSYTKGPSQELNQSVFLVGFSNSNTCDDIYYKSTTTDHWAFLKATGITAASKNATEITEEREADYKQQQCNEATSPALRVRSVPKMNSESSSVANTSDDACFLDPKKMVGYSNKTKPQIQSTNAKSSNAMETYFHSGSSLGRAFLNNNADAAKRTTNMKVLNYEVVQLYDIRLGMMISVCAIITRKIKGPIKVSSGRFCTLIAIKDESVTEELLVNIHYSDKSAEPTLNQYDIVWLTEMKIKKHTEAKRLRGHVYSSNSVVAFSRENPEIIYKQCKSLVFTDKQKRRVKELRTWMFQHLPNSRLFTPISDIKLENACINICGTVVKKKLYENSTTVIIRFCDGTRIGVPAVSYNLDKDRWTAEDDLVIQPPADEVDICVLDPEVTLSRKLEKLEVGSRIELYNVRTAPVHKVVKTVSEYVSKVFLKGDLGNVKIIKQVDLDNSVQYVSSKWSDEQISSADDDEEKEEETSQYRKNNFKRKLFTADSPITTRSPVKDGVFKRQKTFSDKIASPGKQPKKNDAEIGDSRKAIFRNIENIDPMTTNIEESHIGKNKSNIVTSAVVNVHEVEVTYTENINQSKVAATDNQFHDSEENDSPSKGTCIKEIVRPCHVVVTRVENNPQLQRSTSQRLCNIEENHLPTQKSPVSVSRQDSEVDDSQSSSDDDQMSDIQTYSESSTVQAVFQASQHTWKPIQEKVDDLMNEKNSERAKFVVCKQWPLHKKKEFYIRVCITSSIPPIDDTSTDVDIMSLITGHCNSCDRYIPFYFSKWIENGEIVAGHCPKCGKYKQSAATRLNYSIICQLLATDEAQDRRSIMVYGKNAENFLGCTVDQLCSSTEVKMHVICFLNSLIGRKGTILRMRSLDASNGTNKHYEIVS